MEDITENISKKSYIKTPIFANSFSDCFSDDDEIVIQEKLDGSNAGIQYEEINNSLISFSRKGFVNEKSKLFGFYNYVKQMDVIFFKKYKEYIFFGEWNLNHIIKYEDEYIKDFYCFDIYDTVNKNYLLQKYVRKICEEGKIKMVPLFYEGKFISFEHIDSFIGKTEFGKNKGEGIVVKNQTNMLKENFKRPFNFKFVTEEFLEKTKSRIRKPLSLEKLAIKQYKNDLAETIITKVRVEKNIYKMIENDIIPLDWNKEHMKTIAKELPRIIYHDCEEEENDIFVEVGEYFGKLCAMKSMKIVNEILKERIGL